MAGPACPKPAGQICHEFFAADNGRNRLNYVNEFDPTQNWSVAVGSTTANSPRSLELVPNAMGKNGRGLLVSLNDGYAEFDPDNSGVRLVRVTYGNGITGACRIPGTPVTTALGNVTNISIVGETGTLIRNLPLQAGTELRTINRNATNGNFLYSLITQGTSARVFEMSATGAPLWNAPLPAGAKGYTAWWRPAGGVFATTGELGTVVTIDTNTQVVATVQAKTMNPNQIDFFSGFVVLPNGNFVVANWLGHASGAALGDVPQLFEYTPAGMQVWSYGTKAWAVQTTNVLVVR